MTITGHLLYGLAWASFGILHSLLAGQAVKQRLRPLLGSGYRLAYNLFALVHIGAVWLYGQLAFSPVSLSRPDLLVWLQWACLAGGAAFLLYAGRHYDLAVLGGLSQLRGRLPGEQQSGEGKEDPAGDPAGDLDEEPLHTDGLHRFIRHPLYAGVFPVLWGLVHDELSLATAIYASAYLLVGARLEEERLVRRYGDAYRDYRRVVPAFVPWKGRVWTPPSAPE